MAEGDARAWGFWSELKLKILADYLPAFTRASKRSSDTIYLDLFAGTPENTNKQTGRLFDGSARLALDTKPAFTQVSLFEMEPNASLLQADVDARYPGRDGVRIYRGDCNENIGQALAELADWNWAPTFALLDPDYMGIRWPTLQALASFKQPGRWTSTVRKAELLILIGHGYLPRVLQVRKELMNAKVAEGLDDLFGFGDWKPIVMGLREDKLNAKQFGDEIVNLLRCRLQLTLGYKTTHALTFRNINGRALYDMVFATDHPAGDEIIRAVYGNVAAEQEVRRSAAKTLRTVRRKQAKEEAVGQGSLFGPEEVPFAIPERIEVYQHTPIRKPFGSTRRWPFPERAA